MNDTPFRFLFIPFIYIYLSFIQEDGFLIYQCVVCDIVHATHKDIARYFYSSQCD